MQTLLLSLSARLRSAGASLRPVLWIAGLLLLAAPAQAQVSAPGTVNSPEDVSTSFQFSISGWGFTYNNVNVSVVSGTVLQAISLTQPPFGQTGFRLNYTPRANVSGSATVRIAATGIFGSSSSRNVTVNITPVNDAPTLTVINQTINEDTVLNTSIQVGDIDTPLSSVTVTVTSSNQTLVPNASISISGTGASRSLTVVPALHQSGTSTLTVTANDGALSTVRTFVLTVIEVPDPPVAENRTGIRFNGGLDSMTAGSGLAAGSPVHTVETWVRPTAAPATRSWLLQIGAPVAGSHHWLLVPSSPSEVTLQFGVWSRSPQVTGVSIPIGRWTHLASTWDGTTYGVYRNGVLVAEVVPEGGMNLSASPGLAVAQAQVASESGFVGELDELRIWTRVLSRDEIQRGSRVSLTGREDGLLDYWRFDEPSESIAFDSATAGGRLNGTLRGAPSRVLRTTVPAEGLSGEYFAGTAFNTYVATRVDPGVDFDWALGVPHPQLGAENFSVRWRGRLNPPATGTYTFSTVTDDGARLWVDDQLLVDQWIPQGATKHSGTIDLVANQPVDIVMEYYEQGGAAVARLLWEGPGIAEAPIPANRLAPPADPVGEWGRWSVSEGSSNSEIFLTAFDVEFYLGQTATAPSFQILSGPANGTVTPLSGNWNQAVQNPVRYTPNALYNGTDEFTYELTDSQGQKAVGTIRIDVSPRNDPPSATPIASLVIEEGTSTGPLAFTLSDPEQAPSELSLTGFSSDRRLVPDANIVFGGSGAARTVTITPAPGEIGTATINVIISDGQSEFSEGTLTFKVRVDPRPAYSLIDLGAIGLRNFSFGAGINDRGWAVGRIQSQESDAHALLNRGLAGTGVPEDIHPSGFASSRALAINDENTVTGWMLSAPGGARQAFLWNSGVNTAVNLSGISGASDSIGTALNALGDLAGTYRNLSGQRRAFRRLAAGTLLELPTLGGSSVEAFGINDLAEVVGGSLLNTGAERAFLHRTPGGIINLGTLTGDEASRALAINNDGVVVGFSQRGLSPNSPRRAFRYFNGSMTPLGEAFLTGGTTSEAAAVNAFGQVVGTANRKFADGNTENRAFLFTAGRMRDLNDLIHDSRGQTFAQSNWKLQEAHAINRNGNIVGTGLKDGRPRAFLAVPAWVIGRQIARPEGAVERLPEIEILSGNSDDSPLNSFYWSRFEKKLYAIRPVAARLKWYTSDLDVTGSGTNLTVITDRIVVEGVNVWPQDPVIHVAGSPAQVEPQGIPFGYGFQTILHETTGGRAMVDPTSKTFTSTGTGHSVLFYLRTGVGVPPNEATQPPHFDVVLTLPWNDPAHLREREAVVGQVLRDPGHEEYLGRQGHVFFQNAFYDGAGTDRAHDRPSRLGPIIPVNRDTDRVEDDLVVVWYRFNTIGAAWPSVPVRYSVQWPADDVVSRIVIASQRGSGGLDPEVYPDARVYNQPDATQPGFNPNEEHAFLSAAIGESGDALFALRNDLNRRVTPAASEPYALLKHRDPDTREWRIQVYQVVAEDPANKETFRYTATAGTEIQPPYPMSRLPLCDASYGSAGPYWEDYRGIMYARAAGPLGTDTEIHVRWFYPLQPGFYFDLDRDGEPDQPEGACVAWLDRTPAGTLVGPNAGAAVAGRPIATVYDTSWPETPVLQIGETLMDSKNGLPAVRNMASLEIIYDDLQSEWNPLDLTNNRDLFEYYRRFPAATLARLYDPLSARVYRLQAGERIPGSLNRSNRNGREYFDDVPPALRPRLSYDPINRWLQFEGVLDGTGVGEPLLMPNVLSSRERDRLMGMLPAGDVDYAGWTNIVGKLFELTRNPNQVDLYPRDGRPDVSTDLIHPQLNPNPGLRIGLTTESGRVRMERLGDGPKALTAALASVPPAETDPGFALSLANPNGRVEFPAITLLTGSELTLEAWVFPTALTATVNQTVLQQGQGLLPDWFLGFRNSGTAIGFGLQAGPTYEELTAPINPTQLANRWVHIAATYDGETKRLYIDGNLVASAPKTGTMGVSGTTAFLGSAPGGVNRFVGRVDEVRFWNIPRSQGLLQRDRSKRLFDDVDGLVRYYRCDQASGRVLEDDTGGDQDGRLIGASSFVESTAPTGIRPRYMTLVENNDADLGGLKINLHIIRVEDGPFTGDLKVLSPENVFDQRLTLRHSSDFGADPDQVVFEWYMKPDVAGFDPTDLPRVGADGSISDPRGWVRYTAYTPVNGRGVNDITIGDGDLSGLLVMSDNWFVCRLQGYRVGVHPATTWSGWIGDPTGGATPRAMLAEGFVKRVIRGLNPFDQRVRDFHANPAATYASMILQAGQRYEGDIAFSPSADNLNSIGLIEAYTTVLNQAKKLSIAGSPPVDFNPANNALLLAASRIADFYMLLGNEAYADAQDPTIGFGTSSLEYGALAPSIFAFQNQLDSLLSEELSLLRGRDDTAAGVAARPIYNRMFWNFTLGEGEVAYQQTYNISDQDFDGDVDEFDARILYPQGHGDAWGHYLTALTTYYDLLRNTNFTWVPRTERVLVAQAPVEVDFLDERKFATAAAAIARTGREIVDLTYREQYVDDPAGQWQGYRDTDADRAWGVDDWARRGAQGAYFNWLVGNAILPDVDEDPTHTGIRKIDRQTVRELGEIADAALTIQTTMDQADSGLSPIGLARGVVPFDIDPSEIPVEGLLFGRTHYEQVRDRAQKALDNALRVFNEANRATQLLRQNQDSIDDLTRNVREEELAFKNRLIEIFGYPYAGDIGAGRPYPSGYDGPDLYRYMYIDLVEITGERFPPSTNYTGFFKPVEGTPGEFSFYTGDRQKSISDTGTLETSILTIDYPVSAGSYGYAATTAMGKRRALGEVQFALGDIVRAHADLKVALQDYDGLNQDIRDALELLQMRHNLNRDRVIALSTQLGTVTSINIGITVAKVVELAARRTSSIIEGMTAVTTESLPKVLGFSNDATSPARGGIKAAGTIIGTVADIVGDVSEGVQEGLSLSKETVGLSTDLAITTLSQNFEVQQAVKEIEAMVRNEAATRIKVYQQMEVIRDLVGRYQRHLAEGAQVQEQLARFRRNTAADVTDARYQDMTFRIFRNDALRKYRSQFDLAARYVYLAASAYDYESNLLGDDNRAGRDFLTDIVRQRSLGQIQDGEPVIGTAGLADALGRLDANYEVIKTQFGLNNPAVETTRFSLRHELFRMRDENPEDPDDPSDLEWRRLIGRRDPLTGHGIQRMDNLWSIPEFRRYCRPFAPESAGPQPGLVIRFPSTVTFGLNFFGWPLGGGDSSYDSSRFSTRVRSAGVWFQNYDGHGLSQTPRMYLVPVGMDVLRSPDGDNFATREWRVIDQALPVPFPLGANTLRDPLWIPQNDSLGGSFASVRRHAAMRAYHDDGFVEPDSLTTDTRLIGRSVWNTDWMMIIPGGTFLADPDEGLDTFIRSNTDILFLLQSYSYSGN